MMLVLKSFRQTIFVVLSVIFIGCSNGIIFPDKEPAEDINRPIGSRIEGQLIQGREHLQGNWCFERHLKPNLENAISLLELHGNDFIASMPYLLEATLNVAPGRPSEFMLLFYWLSSMENLGGIRVIEFWETEDGIGVIDERYQIFSQEHEHEFYGLVPLLYLALWVQPRESFDIRQDESAWSTVQEQEHGDWLTDVPEIFMGDPREGVQVFMSIFDVKGRESRWFPVRCVFTEADVE